MKLLDVNVLLYAFRRDSERHDEYRAWLLRLIAGESAFGLSEQVLASVVRITTHARIFQRPSSLDEVVTFTEALRRQPLSRIVQPSDRHWPLFVRLCHEAGAKGNLVTDAWFAALAIESGCTWVTADRDYARFPGLTWQHPLDHQSAVVNP